MKIKTLQELYFISSGKDEDFDKSIKMVSVLTGKSIEKVEAMPMKLFNYHCARITKQFERIGNQLMASKPRSLMFANGRIYKLNYDLQRASKYVEGITFAKDVINDIHKLMATIAEPVTWYGKPYTRSHEKIAEDMEHANFEAAYNAAVFFYLQFQISLHLIQPYLIQQIPTEQEKVTETMTSLTKILDGFIMPKWSVNLRIYLYNRFGI